MRIRKIVNTLSGCVVMYKNHTISVVVPAYNEELLIVETLESIPDFVDKIYVVNDCSKDKTQERINAYLPKDPRVVSVPHEVNKGVGAAIVTGYRATIADGIDIAAVMAGDNQMDPAFLPELLDPIIAGKVDYTVGNRLTNPSYRRGMSKWRFFGNSILSLLTKIASGYWQMSDPQNGYTAITRRALETISLDAIYPRYGYCNDLMVRLNVYGFRMRNVPHPARYGREKSGIRYGTYIRKVSFLLLRDFCWRMKMKYVILGFHPLVFYYFFGAIFTLIGLIGGVTTFIEKFGFGYSVLFVHGMLSLVMFTLGMMFLFFAMWFDMQAENADYGWY